MKLTSRSKKLIVLLCMMLLTYGFSTRGLIASNDINLDSSNFPDSNFLLLLKTYDTNEDNKLDPEEVAMITTLEINNPISDITGIKLLDHLSSINFSGDVEIKNIDLSNFNSLTTVTSNYNDNITTINLSNCPNLNNVKFTVCHNVESLNVKGSTNITTLQISGNENSSYPDGVYHCKLSSLDLSDQINLKTLNTRCCSLTSLDLTNNTKLTSLDTCNNHFCYIKGLDKLALPSACARAQKVVVDGVQTTAGLIVDFSKYPDFIKSAFLASDGTPDGVSYNSTTGILTIKDPSKTISGTYSVKGINVLSTFSFNTLYEVNFLVDSKVVSSQRVELNASATVPTGITKNGYTFIGFDQSTTHVTKAINTNAMFKALPIIQANNRSIDINTYFNPFSYVQATDANGEALKVTVIQNTVNTKKAGKYNITYQVVDKWGGKATKTISVTVIGHAFVPITPEVKKEEPILPDPSITIDDVTNRSNITSDTNKTNRSSDKVTGKQNGNYQSNGQGLQNLSSDLNHFLDSDCIIHIILLIMAVVYLIIALLNKLVFKNKKIFNIFSILFIVASLIVYIQGKCSIDIFILLIDIIIPVLFLTLLKTKEKDEKKNSY